MMRWIFKVNYHLELQLLSEHNNYRTELLALLEIHFLECYHVVVSNQYL